MIFLFCVFRSVSHCFPVLRTNHIPDRLSLSLKLWLSQYDWQSFAERENFSKSLVEILFLLSNLEKIISISLSLLESGEPFSKFLFLFSKLGKRISDFSFSSRNWILLKKFSFSSRNLRKEKHFLFHFSKVENLFQISLSLLETGERNFRFLFLFSKLEKRISNFSFSSRLDFLASRQWLFYARWDQWTGASERMCSHRSSWPQFVMGHHIF